MKKIELTRGKFTLVDDGNFSELNKHKWYLSANNGYARRDIYDSGSKSIVAMHRIIVGAQDGQVVDHINGDTLDNRKENLRICTHAQNLQNSKMPNTNKSGYKGVCFHSNTGKWQANIMIGGKAKHLGLFNDKIDAARAYNDAAKENFGQFARLNTLLERQ